MHLAVVRLLPCTLFPLLLLLGLLGLVLMLLLLRLWLWLHMGTLTSLLFTPLHFALGLGIRTSPKHLLVEGLCAHTSVRNPLG